MKSLQIIRPTNVNSHLLDLMNIRFIETANCPYLLVDPVQFVYCCSDHIRITGHNFFIIVIYYDLYIHASLRGIEFSNFAVKMVTYKFYCTARDRLIFVS